MPVDDFYFFLGPLVDSGLVRPPVEITLNCSPDIFILRFGKINLSLAY